MNVHTGAKSLTVDDDLIVSALAISLTVNRRAASCRSWTNNAHLGTDASYRTLPSCTVSIASNNVMLVPLSHLHEAQIIYTLSILYLLLLFLTFVTS